MGKFLDMTGQRIGNLTVIKRAGINRANGTVLWECKCDCGNIKNIPSTYLRKGSKNCGCRFEDITGLKSGELTAVKYIGKRNGQSYWLCQCSCGNTKETSVSKIKKQRIISCGCKKGNKGHGMHGSRIYYIWNSMKQRCSNKNFKDYAIYGGRGITYCDKWETFEGFYDDMGKSYSLHLEKYGSKNTTLDRINSNGNYCKDNCRWATIEEQSYNKRDTIKVNIRGEFLTLKEISIKYNLPKTTLYSRYEKGERSEDLIRPYKAKKQLT